MELLLQPQITLLFSVQEEKSTLRVTAANINFPYFQNILILKIRISKCQQSQALKQSCLLKWQHLQRRFMVLEIYLKVLGLKTFKSILNTNSGLYLVMYSIFFHGIKAHKCSTFLDAWSRSLETSPATKYFDMVVLIYSANTPE